MPGLSCIVPPSRSPPPGGGTLFRAYRARVQAPVSAGAVRAPDCARTRGKRRAHVSPLFPGGVFSRRRETGGDAAPRMPLPSARFILALNLSGQALYRNFYTFVNKPKSSARRPRPRQKRPGPRRPAAWAARPARIVSASTLTCVRISPFRPSGGCAAGVWEGGNARLPEGVKHVQFPETPARSGRPRRPQSGRRRPGGAQPPVAAAGNGHAPRPPRRIPPDASEFPQGDAASGCGRRIPLRLRPLGDRGRRHRHGGLCRAGTGAGLFAGLFRARPRPGNADRPGDRRGLGRNLHPV